jgi:hypothetical protein
VAVIAVHRGALASIGAGISPSQEFRKIVVTLILGVSIMPGIRHVM